MCDQVLSVASFLGPAKLLAPNPGGHISWSGAGSCGRAWNLRSWKALPVLPHRYIESHVLLTLEAHSRPVGMPINSSNSLGASRQCASPYAGNNIALDASATRRLNSAQQSHSPRKKPKLEPSPSVSQQAPATVEGHTPSGSIHQPAQPAEQQRGDPSEPGRHHEHQNGEQQVSLTTLTYH